MLQLSMERLAIKTVNIYKHLNTTLFLNNVFSVTE